MRVLVIGGTRFIGPPVVRRLVQLGHDVTVLHRGETEIDLPSSVQHLHADRERLSAARDEIRRAAPDVVIDIIALTEAAASGAVEAFRGVAQRLVVISSQDVYRAYGRFHGTEPGPLEPLPMTEDSPLRTALYPYRGRIAGLDDYDKILVERAAASASELPVTIVRLPAVYGAGDYQHRLAIELKRMDDGRPAILIDERLARWRWTRAYVENAAAAIALAATAERAAGRAYNAGDDALSYADWMRAIGRAAGWTGEVIAVPSDRLPKHLRPPPADYEQDLVTDSTRIRRELGYEDIVSPDEGLRRAIEWERANRA
jgi:nucleoside-diphosphate-sugar epimerase